MRSHLQRLDAWLDDRTGYRDFVREALYESIPGGARWRYVWGSTLVFTFTMQVITGLFLWMAYSPSAQTAWESVFYIQHEMQGGWLLRGLHHFTAQAMIVLLVLHLMQVVIDGAYRAPREVNFWLGLILMQIVLGLSLTGYLLPWDQKGFWATRVATELMGLVPLIGEDLQRLVVGGPTYGHHTLTRFFALHAGVLPSLLVFFLVLHVYMFRRHGICHKQPLRGDHCTFWPDQLLKDAVACLAVLAVILGLVILPAISSDSGDFDTAHLGAELGAPADPAETFAAARPEWYFLFLFEFLKLFPGKYEIVGALVVPGFVLLLMFLMPIIGRWRLGHRFNVGLTCGLVLGAGILTVAAKYEDLYGDGSSDYITAVADADEEAKRAVELARARSGIPPEGALTLLRNDPKTHGRRLFTRKCTICHGKQLEKNGPRDGAPALEGFATQEWIAGLLDPQRITTPEYFGSTETHSSGEMGMVEFVKGDLQKWKPEEVRSVVLALSAEAQLRSQAHIEQAKKKEIDQGIALLKDSDRGCAQCHKFHDAGDLGMAPDLTGYGTRQWLIDFISNPADERFYGDENERMPLFGKEQQLKPDEIGMIADYLRGDWYEPPQQRSGVAASR